MRGLLKNFIFSRSTCSEKPPIVIAALADLFAEPLERDFLAEMPERLLPREDMEFVGIDERPVEIENRGADHFVSAFSSLSVSGNGGGFAAPGMTSRGNCT